MAGPGASSVMVIYYEHQYSGARGLCDKHSQGPKISGSICLFAEENWS